MYTFIALCTFVVIAISGVWSHVCTDCMNFNKCPLALERAINRRDQATIDAFKAALCGFDRSGRKSIVKPEQEETAEDIANHPNLNLLPRTCGVIEPQRIGGRRIGDLNEFPWMALIAHQIPDGISFQCGGSIINKRYVLTAAHCVHGKNILGVRVGGYDINEYYECRFQACDIYVQDTPVEQAIVHPDYHGLRAVVNDIALIRVADPLNFGLRNIRPICLPNTEKLRNKPLDNVYAVVAGWGLTENGAPSSILRKFTIPILAADSCYSFLNRYTRSGEFNATASLLCAGAFNKDSCNGDAGGPLMVIEEYNNVNRYLQYGVVSYAHGRCGVDNPGVYTDVTKFMGWILDNLAP